MANPPWARPQSGALLNPNFQQRGAQPPANPDAAAAAAMKSLPGGAQQMPQGPQQMPGGPQPNLQANGGPPGGKFTTPQQMPGVTLGAGATPGQGMAPTQAQPMQQMPGGPAGGPGMAMPQANPAAAAGNTAQNINMQGQQSPVAAASSLLGQLGGAMPQGSGQNLSPGAGSK